MEEDDHERSPGDHGRPGEISPYNPNAVRGPNGIWNEETLPVTGWEAAEHRVVVPLHLQQSLLLPTSVLRWSKDKHELVLTEHARDAAVVFRLTYYLDRWECHGRESSSGNRRILLRDENGRWYSITVGLLQGSYNVVTAFGGSDKRFLRQRLNGLSDLVVRGDE